MALIQAIGGGVMTPHQQQMADSWWLDGWRVIPPVGDYGCFASRRLKVCAAAW